jgi:hypothetical protein
VRTITVTATIVPLTGYAGTASSLTGTDSTGALTTLANTIKTAITDGVNGNFEAAVDTVTVTANGTTLTVDIVTEAAH